MNNKPFDCAYQAPEISIIDMTTEGVLCQSGGSLIFGEPDQAGGNTTESIWGDF